MGFKEDVNNGQKDYGGLPFWSWNDKLDPKELRRQMGVMKDLGMNGFFMHARGGLETDYLSDDWFECIDACVDEAKKLDMQAWSYDENGWPSGFAGGKVLENPWNLATYLMMEESASFVEITKNNPPERHAIAEFVAENNTYKRVTEECGADKYYVVYQCYDPSYVDVMDPAIIKEFIQDTHAEYKKRTGKDFGGAMPGFFTDEPQYYRYHTTYSNLIPENFKKTYGYDVLDKIIALFVDFDGADEFRFDYWYLCHKMFINGFPKTVYDWCDENGCQLTGHAIEEFALFTQMWCCGGIMPFYEYEHIPGMDYLGRGINGDQGGKQLGSVCAQLGKKKALTETFACCGWDVTPRELKKIAELQYASGVNVMCHHLYAYSIRGQRKRDYPANYSEHLPWQKEFGDFVKYFNRLGYVLSRGKEKVNTLIINPIHSEYLTYKREVDLESVRPIEEGYGTILADFSDNQIPYHIGDEQIMERHACVKGNKFIVGEMSYDFVVLPRIFTLDSNTAKLLKEFKDNGGKIYLYDCAPDRIDGRKEDLSWLTSTVTFEDIKANAFVSVKDAEKELCNGVKTMSRDTEYGRVVYIVNVSDNDYKDVTVKIPGVKKLSEVFLEEADWNDGGIRKCDIKETDDGVEIKTSFESGKSRLFVEKTCVCAKAALGDGLASAGNAGLKLSGEYRLAEKPENMMTLDFAKISYDGGKTYEEAKPIIQIFDEILQKRFKGDVTLKFEFKVAEIPAKISMAAEPMKYSEITVNGEKIAFGDGWWLDRQFKTCDITKFVKTGDNAIIMTFDYFQRDYVYTVLYGNVMESLRNCLAFDTEIECIYLFGDFSVKTPAEFVPSERRSFLYDGEFVIEKSKETVDIDNVVKDGFPFFGGKLVLEKTFEFDGNGTELWLDGRFSVADVYINGKYVKRLMFTDHCNVEKFLKKGKNTLKLVLGNSNRNLLGPHHYADPEPYALGPVTFSLENMWHDGKCDAFRPSYSFVRFGTEVVIK